MRGFLGQDCRIGRIYRMGESEEMGWRRGGMEREWRSGMGDFCTARDWRDARGWVCLVFSVRCWRAGCRCGERGFEGVIGNRMGAAEC